jgi:hypothetical protein
MSDFQGANVIVAQTMASSIQRVAKDIARLTEGAELPNRLSFAMRPESVLEHLQRGRVDIVVTGQMFYDEEAMTDSIHKLFGAESSFAVVSELLRYRMANPVKMDGKQLSEEIYKRHPEVLVFRYSVMPSGRGRLVGDIPKENRNLARLLVSPDLARAVRERDWDGLQSIVPAMTIYEAAKSEYPTL